MSGAKKATGAAVTAAPVGAQGAGRDPDAGLREICRRNGLPHCWKDRAGHAHFDAGHAATLDQSTLTLIEA